MFTKLYLPRAIISRDKKLKKFILTFFLRAKGWIMYRMDSKFKLGDKLKNFKTIKKIVGFIA